MKRKTNLFYLSGDDANFLTFSNYTESLTGTILSTDNKIFPSKFLCFNINNENTDKPLEECKQILKKYLIAYYENKLAKIRDYQLENENIEITIKPLNYLLETFDIIKEREGIIIELVYVGEISEQDYNGTFNDMICTIDTNNLKRGEIIYKEENENSLNDSSIITINNNIQDNDYKGNEYHYLYGWVSNSEIDDEGNLIYEFSEGIPDSYKTIYPVFDKINEDESEAFYYINSNISKIDYSLNDKSKESIIFDLVVPLYDLVDINYQNNFISQDENITEINLDDKEIDNLKDFYNYNIPYGIWIGTDKIILTRDGETSMGPSWSLVLSSQFKPFPYTNNMPNELEISKKPEAYYTFAQILARQNEILDEFDKINNTLSDINKRVLSLETKLNITGSAYTTEILNKNMMNWEKEMTEKYNNLENTLYTYLDNLNWKFRNG